MSEMETLQMRMSAVETRQDRTDAHYDTLCAKMDALTEKIGVLATAIAVSGSKECQAPGLCITLKPRIEVLEIAVEKLKEAKVRAEGMISGSRATLIAIWTMFGGSVVVVGKWLFDHITTK